MQSNAADPDYLGKLLDLAAVVISALAAWIAVRALNDQQAGRREADQGTYYRERVANPALDALSRFVDRVRAFLRGLETFHKEQHWLELPGGQDQLIRTQIDRFNEIHLDGTEPVYIAVSGWGDDKLNDRVQRQIEDLQDLNENIALIIGGQITASKAIAVMLEVASRITRIIITYDPSTPDKHRQQQRERYLKAFHK